MREIKFRLWEDTKKRWVKEFMVNPEGRVEVFLVNDPNNVILTQYTDIKDKNGKEIYEGDIVNYFPFKPKNAEVIWSDGGYYLSSNEEVWSLSSYTVEEDEVIIIGNIFENPELL